MNRSVIMYGVTLLMAMQWISCNSEGEGNARSGKERILKEERFYAVQLGMDADAVFQYGKKQSISVSGEDNVLDNIRTETFKGKWRIYLEEGIEQESPIYLTVVSPGLEGVTAMGSGKMRIEGDVLTEKGHLVVRENYDAEVTSITSPAMQVLHYGSGQIRLSGKSGKLTAFINAEGDIRANDLDLDSLRAVVKGTGEVEVDEISHLDAIITGPGAIRYAGEPEIKEVVRGGGQLIKK